MSSSPVRLVLRIVAALLVAAGGVLHLRLWLDQYRDVPSDLDGAFVVNPGFLVNAALSAVLAIAVVVMVRRPIVWLAAAVFEFVSIAALVLSRSSTGVLGWKEPDWSTDAKQVLAVEVAAVVVLVLLLAVDFASSNPDDGVTDDT